MASNFNALVGVLKCIILCSIVFAILLVGHRILRASDPITTAKVSYSAYVGSLEYDRVQAIAVDNVGRAILVGQTRALTLPNVIDDNRTDSNIFVAKIAEDGTSVEFIRMLGGSDEELGLDVALDSAGNIFVTGWTASSDFPVTTNAVFQGERDAFVAKISASNELVYVTLIGGSGVDEGQGIVVKDNKIYVTGGTTSSDFIDSTLVQTPLDSTLNGFDAFVARLDDTNATVTYATYLGGTSDDIGTGIAIDTNDNLYVLGNTFSDDFPITAGVFNSTFGNGDGFLVKFQPGIANIMYGTFLGGSGLDEALAITLDRSGDAYVTGFTQSGDFETKPNPDGYDNTHNGAEDAYVVKIDTTAGLGQDLVYSTFIGGSNLDIGRAIALDGTNNVYIAGETQSADLPVTPYSSGDQAFGAGDAFVGKLRPDGTKAHLTYLGGVEDDAATALAVHSSFRAYVGGETASSDLMMSSTTFSNTFNGGSQDGFLTQFEPIFATIGSVDLYVRGTPPEVSPSEANVQIIVEYGNQGTTIANSLTFVAELDNDLVYVSNNSGTEPTTNNNRYTWNFPAVEYLDLRTLEIIVQMPPRSPVKASYPVTLTVEALPGAEVPAAPTPNQDVIFLLQPTVTYLPLIVR
ncbi:MAG: SBBP repeat-containing protein [Chloroflexota bacterium]